MMGSVGKALEETRDALRAANISDTPDLEATLLVSHATSLDRTGLITKRDKLLTETETATLKKELASRLENIPMAYILGHREFYDLDFKVDCHVLIPRSDTETLIEAVKDHVTPSPDLNILDLCTGSGCIGITLSHLLSCPVTLADISTDALAVAKENAERLIPGRFTLTKSDLCSSIHEIYAIIVSNPPYLTDAWIAEAEEQVRKEPRLALDGKDADGLGLIRRLIPEATGHLKKGGMLFLECDSRQCGIVRRLFLENGYDGVRIEKDLAGRDRVVWGKRHV
jgi:release factor glutamine methyltransferase